jgi:hypothetical protein
MQAVATFVRTMPTAVEGVSASNKSAPTFVEADPTLD